MSFFDKGSDKRDQELRLAALEGDAKALGELIETHRDFLYNVVWKMVMNPQDAEDITQDIIIKVITNLAKFRGESKFRTWIYRIAYNHVINLPKRPIENTITGFDVYGHGLDTIKDKDYVQAEEPTAHEALVIEDAMLGCTAGMLMCLDRDQRMVIILGEIFGIDSQTAAEITGDSPENFRQKLSRSRKQLYNFMQNKCGLINKANPCRCRNKTKGFIERGYVDPNNLEFNVHYQRKIWEKSEEAYANMGDLLERSYAEIYHNHPWQERPAISERIMNIIEDGDFRVTFDLN